ncbi:hypothetical protein EVAR_79132_1 [Eumeta japonica]|uniref:Uncharacterized protein n=1 Tax=Eumeta variegata TaxID=151549 RepID=A0A4C1USZ2_EUMVA|nr:hypothetical protein EVAR_79132_1 [Eumeta japonica]
MLAFARAFTRTIVAKPEPVSISRPECGPERGRNENRQCGLGRDRGRLRNRTRPNSVPDETRGGRADVSLRTLFAYFRASDGAQGMRCADSARAARRMRYFQNT